MVASVQRNRSDFDGLSPQGNGLYGRTFAGFLMVDSVRWVYRYVAGRRLRTPFFAPGLHPETPAVRRKFYIHGFLVPDLILGLGGRSSPRGSRAPSDGVVIARATCPCSLRSARRPTVTRCSTWAVCSEDDSRDACASSRGSMARFEMAIGHRWGSVFLASSVMLAAGCDGGSVDRRRYPAPAFSAPSVDDLDISVSSMSDVQARDVCYAWHASVQPQGTTLG